MNNLTNQILNKISMYSIHADKSKWGTNIDAFDWVPGVGLYGIYKAYTVTGQQALLDYLISWIDTHLDEAFRQTTVNSTCPLLTVISVYEITHNEEYLRVCRQLADFIIEKAPITREGGLEHTVTESNGHFSEQMWADTLFMAVLFLAKMGAYDRRYADFAVNQLKVHLQYLFDEEKKLFYHGWNCELGNHMSAVFWARANAWVIYSAAEMIEILGEFDGYNVVCEYIRKHAYALKQYQREDGGFSTITDDLTSYDEASASAGIIAGIKHSVLLGILPEEYNSVYDKGIMYLRNLISESGEVQHVSSGTPVMADAQAYKKISIRPTLYGQGMAAMAFVFADKD